MKDFEHTQDAWGGLVDSFGEQLDQIIELGPYTIQLVDDAIRQLNESYREHMEVFDDDLLIGDEEEVTLQVVGELLAKDFEQSSLLERGDLVCITGETIVVSVNPASVEASAHPVSRGGRVIGRLERVAIGESPLEDHLASWTRGDDEGDYDQADPGDIAHEISPILILEGARYEEADDDRGSGVYRDNTFPDGDIVFVPTHYSGLVVAKVVSENSRS